MKNKFKSLSTILEERNSNRYKKRITSIVSEIRAKQIDYKNSTLLDLKNKIQTYKDKKISNEIDAYIFEIEKNGGVYQTFIEDKSELIKVIKEWCIDRKELDIREYKRILDL